MFRKQINVLILVDSQIVTYLYVNDNKTKSAVIKYR